MRTLFFLGALIYSTLVLATPAPANYPIVNGVVRKIDLASNRVSLKHDDIPNLKMPGMTMSFVVSHPEQMQGLAVGDKVHFAADEVDGELTAIWIEKVAAPAPALQSILCTGIAPTAPKTNVEIEIRPGTYSLIRYEQAEGSWKGTAHINSLGNMEALVEGDQVVYQSGDGPLDSRLTVQLRDGQLTKARFTKLSANLKNAPVNCAFQDSFQVRHRF